MSRKQAFGAASDLGASPPSSDRASYSAARRGAALLERAGMGCLLLTGRDGADLLHRLTTNDIAALGPGEGTRTLWLTPQGRMVALLTVYRTEDSLMVLTGGDQTSDVLERLERNIFFGDEVAVEDSTCSYQLLQLCGSRSLDVLDRLTDSRLNTLPLYHHRRMAIQGIHCLVARDLPIGSDGFLLLLPTAQAMDIRTALQEAGARPISSELHEILRVEHGYPAEGREIREDFIPLEAGLQSLISFTKGCYPGQEVIARMDSRQRLAKRLCGIRLDGSVRAPIRLSVDGRDAGVLTSAVESPRFGSIGLAYMRSAFAESGQAVSVGKTAVNGEIVPLPFIPTRSSPVASN